MHCKFDPENSSCDLGVDRISSLHRPQRDKFRISTFPRARIAAPVFFR
jgi:hypothetical protein